MKRCRNGTRKCVDRKCHKQKKLHHFRKTKKMPRCKKGSRRCRNLVCYKMR